MLSLLYLICYLLRHRERRISPDVPDSSGTLMRQILAIGIPITLSNSAMSIITLVDTKIVLGRLRDIPALAEATMQAWVEEIVEKHFNFGNPQDCLIPLVEGCIARKRRFCTSTALCSGRNF